VVEVFFGGVVVSTGVHWKIVNFLIIQIHSFLY
jgi:hypothetical protein